MADRAARRQGRVVDEFALEGREEALGQRVVVAVAGAAHRDRDLMRGQHRLIRDRRVLTAAIAMMEDEPASG